MQSMRRDVRVHGAPQHPAPPLPSSSSFPYDVGPYDTQRYIPLPTSHPSPHNLRAPSYGAPLSHSRSTPAGLSHGLHERDGFLATGRGVQGGGAILGRVSQSPEVDAFGFDRFEHELSPGKLSAASALTSSAPFDASLGVGYAGRSASVGDGGFQFEYAGQQYRASPPPMQARQRGVQQLQSHVQSAQSQSASSSSSSSLSSAPQHRRPMPPSVSHAAAHQPRLQSHPYYRPPPAPRPAPKYQPMADAQSRSMSQPAPPSSYLLPQSYSPPPGRPVQAQPTMGPPLSFVPYDEDQRAPSQSPSYDTLPAAVNAITINSRRADDAFHPHGPRTQHPFPPSHAYHRPAASHDHHDIDLTNSPLPASPPPLQSVPSPSPPPPPPAAPAPISSSPPSPPSTISLHELGDRYTLLDYLGSGSYGHVHLARHVLEGSRVAIKKIVHIFDNLTNAKRLLREIKILRMLRHENVIRFYHLLPPSQPLHAFNDLSIVFEFVDTDLQKLIHSNQHFSTLHVQYFMYQLCCGIAYVHSANIIHRDLKPANVLVNADCSLKICESADTTPQHSTAQHSTAWWRWSASSSRRVSGGGSELTAPRCAAVHPLCGCACVVCSAV